MAYFPNSSAADEFENGCIECIHADEEACCPIYMIQNSYNYEQIGNDKLREALNMLVDDEKGCRMRRFIIKDKEE